MNSPRRAVDVRYMAIAISLLLSAWHVLVNPMPNVDAFTYVRVANIFLAEGLSAAFDYYPSAVYPVLIAELHRFTGLELFASAHLLNALFFALLVYAFISLAMEVRNSRRLALLAAVTILIFPQLNEYRYMLIRDIAFIGFILLGLLHLIRFNRNQKLRNGLYFCLATAIAAAFRSEALAYIALGPLALLLNDRVSTRTRLLSLCKIELVAIALLAVAVGAASSINIDIVAAVQEAVATYRPFFAAASVSLNSVTSPISTAVFGEYGANFSGQYIALFLIAGLSAILLLKLVTGFGVPVLLVMIYGFAKRLSEVRNRTLYPVFWYALIAFIILLTFLLFTRFISTRYTLLFCTTLLVLVPLTIDNVLQKLPANRNAKTIKYILGFLALFCAIDAHISFGESKASVQDASNWLVANVQPNEAVLTNSSYVAYESGLVEDYDRVSRYIDSETISNAQYGTVLALSLDRGVDTLVQHALEFQEIVLIQRFPENGDAEFAIYRRLGN